jgi:hypothetical protein
MMATFFTLTYSLRLVGVVFIGVGLKSKYFLAEEFGMILPISMLLMLSVFAGCWFNFFLVPQTIVYMRVFYKMFLIGALIFIVVVGLNKLKSVVMGVDANYEGYKTFIGGIWFLPFLTSLIVLPTMKLGLKIVKLFDQGWLEYMSGQGSIKYMNNKRFSLVSLDYVSIKFYMFSFFFLLVVLGIVAIYFYSLLKALY